MGRERGGEGCSRLGERQRKTESERERGDVEVETEESVWRKRRLTTAAELLGPFRKAHRTSVSCRATATEERTSEAAEKRG